MNYEYTLICLALRLLNNLQLFKLSIEVIDTVTLSCFVYFNSEFDHIWLSHELLMVAIDHLIPVLLVLFPWLCRPSNYSALTFPPSFFRI